MAKSKKLQKVEKTTKITGDQLKDLKDQQQKINTLLINLGSASVATARMMKEHDSLHAVWETTTQALEKEYGQVNINMETGAVSPIEAEE